MTTSGQRSNTTVDELVERILLLLRTKMQEIGMSQLDVQESLDWGRTYISQLFRKQKALRVDQVLKILETLGIEPKDFFAELFGEPPTSKAGPPTQQQKDRLDRVLAEAYHARQREHHGVDHQELCATVRSLVCFIVTLGGAPMEHFIEIYRREMDRDGLLPKEDPYEA